MVEQTDWESPRAIFQHEYSSIVKAFYEVVLRPIAHQPIGQPEITTIDRDALDFTLLDLNNKTNYPQFENLPLSIKNAYTSFRNFVQALKNNKDEEVVQNLDVIRGVFPLLGNCITYGDGYMRGLYFGRNPCRESQYKLYSSLNKARKNQGSLILDSIQELLGVCSDCPYKATL